MIVSIREAYSFLEIARVLHDEFSSKNYKIPMTRAPNFIVKLGSFFDSTLTQLTNILSVKTYYDNTRMVSILGVQPIDIKKTIVDAAYSLIEKGVVPKKF